MDLNEYERNFQGPIIDSSLMKLLITEKVLERYLIDGVVQYIQSRFSYRDVLTRNFKTLFSFFFQVKGKLHELQGVIFAY